MPRELLPATKTCQNLSGRREQMYKKRIGGWGLSKNIKAKDKKLAIGELLRGGSTETVSSNIRPDKLIRYAKSHSIDTRPVSRVVKRGVRREHKPPITSRNAPRNNFGSSMRYPTVNAVFLPRSATLPDRHADFDMFLRAMKSLIEKERLECLVGLKGPPDGIFNPLVAGIAYWHKNALGAARRSFGRAAQNVADDLQGSVVSVSRITYCISSMMWGSEREPVFEDFAQFMAKAALEALGQGCPLTVVLQHLQNEQSLDAQLAIWSCALDDYKVSEHNLDHWWGMARRRWQWCQRGGMINLAVQYCAHALTELHLIDKLTDEMRTAARDDLGSNAPAMSHDTN